MLTRQEIFNKVSSCLLKQMEKSISLKGCAYRGDGGLKCAIGHLIPDKEYKEELEGRTIISLFETFPAMMERIGLSRNDKAFLDSLQGIHDSNNPCDWEERLRDFAYVHNLIFKEPEECLCCNTTASCGHDHS